MCAMKKSNFLQTMWPRNCLCGCFNELRGWFNNSLFLPQHSYLSIDLSLYSSNGRISTATKLVVKFWLIIMCCSLHAQSVDISLWLIIKIHVPIFLSSMPCNHGYLRVDKSPGMLKKGGLNPSQPYAGSRGSSKSSFLSFFPQIQIKASLIQPISIVACSLAFSCSLITRFVSIYMCRKSISTSGSCWISTSQ